MINYIPFTDDRIQVLLYTFGAPMVGNMAYVRWWNDLNIIGMRNFNNKDGVSYLPPSCYGEEEYNHVAKP